MNSQQRKIAQKYLEQENKKHSAVLKLIPKDEWCNRDTPKGLSRVWRSNRFAVQEYLEGDGSTRLTVNRTAIDEKGAWVEGITWDELMAIKRQAGYGEWFAVEIYPADDNVVNVANMRHLWIPEKPLSIGWKQG